MKIDGMFPLPAGSNRKSARNESLKGSLLGWLAVSQLIGVQMESRREQRKERFTGIAPSD